MSEERAVWVLWGLAALAGGVGLLLRTSERTYALLGGGMMVVVLALVGSYLLHARFRHLEGEQTRSTGLYERFVAFHVRFPVLLLALDLLLVGLAYYGSYLLRWEEPQLAEELVYFRRTLPVVLVVKLVVYGAARGYGADLRRFGLPDTLHFLKTNFIATATLAVVLLMLQRAGLSRGILVIDFLLSSVLVLGGRFSFRIMEGWVRRWSTEGVPAVILGDADDLETALRELERGRSPHLRPVALADRRGRVRKGRLGGYALFGGKDALELALRETSAEAVIFVERDEEGGEGGREEGGGPLRTLSTDHSVDVYSLRLGITLSREDDS
jgi:UDP-GlcNAc:undecaprenyl-phosphate GlcNAc-1-phosphate transferase